MSLIASAHALAAKAHKPQPAPVIRTEPSVLPALPVEESAPGSLYTSSGLYADLSRDMRAHQLNDLITIVVADKASAVTKGASQSQRTSSAQSSINSLAGPLSKGSALANLLSLSGNTQLQGQGSTSRESTLDVTLTARVMAVLANGNLVIEGAKNIQVNSDSQRVVVRGVIRQNDISGANSVLSDQVADLEVHINGKGLVNSAVKQPNILYRIILGLLPF